MTTSDRRGFLRLMTGTSLAASFSESISRALAIPASSKTGTIADVEHIVILMQENRSFDHYFGTLRGVRGFGDPHPVQLTTGKSVWYQPNGSGYVLPFHPTAPHLGLQFLEDLAHDWDTTHAAWNLGQYDGWVLAKGQAAMAHYTRQDIPFHYALADAFTICDAYHCSVLGPTDPNRYYMWTGWVGNDGKGGGPVVDNAEAGYDWSTYPELLQKAGITWKVYQDVGLGLTAAGSWGWTSDPYIGNYGDNSLLYFHQYQNAPAGSPLADGAKTGTDISVRGTLFDEFRRDVAHNTLPQVSWIVAPEAYTEHPNWPANYGAWYVSQILHILTSNPEVWSKTALFLTYDENDGFFDHIVPPTVPAAADGFGRSNVPTTNELFPGSATYPPGPYGLGVRVPMLVISPWSKGGYVCSEVFDHTSLIRFIEQRFKSTHPGIIEPNITRWRRAVCGDLTAAFNFRTPNDGVPRLPNTGSYAPPDHQRHADYVPTVPATQALPAQEKGVRLARALPYDLNARAYFDHVQGRVVLEFTNSGTAGACFHVRSALGGPGPWSYTVAAGSTFADIPLATSAAAYDLSVYGPNGFFRSFKGRLPLAGVNLTIHAAYRRHSYAVEMVITNHGSAAVSIRVSDGYGGAAATHALKPGETFTRDWALYRTHGWYDLLVTIDGDASFAQRFAGHLENGKDSISDLAIGA